MSWSLALQTIGLILMVEGSIIAIYELWKKKLNYLIEKNLNDAEMALIDSFDTFFKLFEDKDRIKSKKKVISNKESEVIIDKFYKFLYYHIKRKLLEEFRDNIINFGIMYLVLGAILQILGLWI